MDSGIGNADASKCSANGKVFGGFGLSLLEEVEGCVVVFFGLGALAALEEGVGRLRMQGTAASAARARRNAAATRTGRRKR